MFGDDAANPARVRVKICGITNSADAETAIAAGADAIGLNCYSKSRRYIDLALSADWIQHLSGDAKKIAVLVNPSRDEALAIAELSFIDGLQLHGHESSEFCADLACAGVRFAKAFPVSADGLIGDPSLFATETVVLDSVANGEFGGTGNFFPWTIARHFVEAHPKLRVILAGGLTPENVAQAVAEVRPFAVDVTTGVESSPGQKNHDRLKDFIAAARSA